MKEDMSFKIDWLSFTVHAVNKIADYIWDRFFMEHLGILQEKGHGGRGYKRIREAEQGSKIYMDAVNDLSHFHIELPGKATGCLPHDVFSELFLWLQNIESGGISFKFKITRIDLAFDNIPFTPEMYKLAIKENRLRSLTQRRSLTDINSPFMEREDGSGFGQETVYFGSSSSSRRVRVYNKRGPVRFEFVAKGKRADQIGRSIFYQSAQAWPLLAIGHIRDFIDIYQDLERTQFADWWLDFVQSAGRARMTVYSSKDINEFTAKTWLETQVSKWLFVIDKKDHEWLVKTISEASNHLRPHHKRVLEQGNE